MLSFEGLGSSTSVALHPKLHIPVSRLLRDGLELKDWAVGVRSDNLQSIDISKRW
jgi:hypothetical protein